MGNGTRVEIATDDGTAEAYLTGRSGPGVLLVMDVFGIRPRIEDMADRIASWGYVVLAPNVFYREGTIDQLAPDVDMTTPGGREEAGRKAMPRIGGLTPERAEADLPHYLEALRRADGVTGEKLGATGYCMGAKIAVRAACLDRGVVAVGGWHSPALASDDEGSPHEKLGQARAEFVFGHADNDRSNPPEAIERLGRALDDAGLTAKNEVYEGAPHGYSMADTSAYDEAATERHFGELDALFGRTL